MILWEFGVLSEQLSVHFLTATTTQIRCRRQSKLLQQQHRKHPESLSWVKALVVHDRPNEALGILRHSSAWINSHIYLKMY